jgi:hypothetical protein
VDESVAECFVHSDLAVVIEIRARHFAAKPVSSAERRHEVGGEIFVIGLVYVGRAAGSGPILRSPEESTQVLGNDRGAVPCIVEDGVCKGACVTL